MKIARNWVLVPALLAFVAAQQTVDPLSIFVSEAFSVYTQIASVLASAASEASVAAASSASATLTSSTVRASTTSTDERSTTTLDTSTSTSTSSDSSSSSSSHSTSPSTTSSASSEISSYSASTPSPITTSSPTLSPAVLGTSSVLGTTAETGTTRPLSSGSSHTSTLPIILGCVLGALALGLFILALVLCCRRRRHGQSPRHRALSPGDDEVDSWRVSRASGLTGNRAPRHGLGLARAAPLMSEHPAFRSHEEHENPFVPVPPPPRRTAFNSGTGLTDGAIQSDDPLALTKEISRASSIYSNSSNDDSGHKGVTAAGLVGAAAGAGLMDHHKKNKDATDPASEEIPVSEPTPHRQVSRKPVPINHVNNSEPWPYSPISPIDPAPETTALARTPPRTSVESRRSFSRDAARANAAFDQEYAPNVPGPGTWHDRKNEHGQGAGAAGLAAGALGGAAIAHHRQNRRRSRSSLSGEGGGSHGQVRWHSQPPPVPQGEGSDLSSSSSGTSRESYSNSDTPVSQTRGADDPSAMSIQDDTYDIPLVPPTRSRRNSALGTGAPASAALSYVNRPAIPSPLSSEVLRDRSVSPSRGARRRSGGPVVSSHFQPAIHDGPAHGYGYGHDYDYTPFPPMPNVPAGGGAGAMGAHPDEIFPDTTEPQEYSYSQKGIVGDNGYPHMGIPRRKSGGEYDFATTGPLGPQTLPPTVREPQSSRTVTMGSDDSTWRLSEGMPGGWQRDYSPRNSRDYSGDSSVSGHLSVPASASVGGGGGIGVVGMPGRRRLRASDFAARDDQRDAFGYDGAEGRSVGQAL